MERRIPAARSGNVDFPEPFLFKSPVIIPSLRVRIMLCGAQLPQRHLYSTSEEAMGSSSPVAFPSRVGPEPKGAEAGVEGEETVVMLLSFP